MQLKQYVVLFRRWAWLLILASIVAAGVSYLYSRTIQPIYRAQTMLLVGRAVQNTDPTFSDAQAAMNLADAYALLATQPLILQATADAIHWPESWQTLYYKVSASTVSNQLLRITVTDTDPARTAVIADEVAQQLIAQGPVSSEQQRTQEQSAFVGSELSQLKVQIQSARKTLTSLQNQAALERDPLKLVDQRAQISAQEANIASWEMNYASLSSILNSPSLPFVTVLAPAQVPEAPTSPDIPRNLLIGIMISWVLAGGAILLFEHLDDTIKDADDVRTVLDVSTLGAITRFTHIQKPTDHVVTLAHPRSPTAEAYRVLRTNLRFSGIENPSGALLVTSAGPGEGKSTTAANLAVIMAQSGKRVILMDADLRRPSLHKFFGVSNNVGLTNLFLGDMTGVESVMRPTGIESLRFIPSGHIPPNPAEILESSQMKRIISDLRGQCDMLILDSPPVLAVADPSILGSRCSGAILVVDAGRTRSEVCYRALDTLNHTGTKVFGVVLNKLSTRRASGYYYYYHYYSRSEKGQISDEVPAEAIVN